MYFDFNENSIRLDQESAVTRNAECLKERLGSYVVDDVDSAGDLTARLQAALDELQAPVIFIGSDCPELAADDLHAITHALGTHDVAPVHGARPV